MGGCVGKVKVVPTFSSDPTLVSTFKSWQSEFVNDCQSHFLVRNDLPVFPKELVLIVASFLAPTSMEILNSIKSEIRSLYLWSDLMLECDTLEPTNKQWRHMEKAPGSTTTSPSNLSKLILWTRSTLGIRRLIHDLQRPGLNTIKISMLIDRIIWFLTLSEGANENVLFCYWGKDDNDQHLTVEYSHYWLANANGKNIRSSTILFHMSFRFTEPR